MKKGLTLLEVMIASAIFMVIAGVALLTSMSAQTQSTLNTDIAMDTSSITELEEVFRNDLSQSDISYDGIDPDGNPVSNETLVFGTDGISLTFRVS